MRDRRTGRGRLVVVTSLVCVIVGAVAPKAGAVAPYETAAIRFSTGAVHAPSALRVAIDYLPAGRNGKPWAVSKVVITLAKGTVIDTSAVARCTANTLVLMLRGAAACPDDSVVGGGFLTLDTGAPGLRNQRFDVVLVNDANELIFVLHQHGGMEALPPFVVNRASITDGRVITSTIMPVPGLPPPDTFTALKQVRLSVNETLSDYLTTPSSCPRSGEWVNTATFTYHDKVVQTTRTSVACG